MREDERGGEENKLCSATKFETEEEEREREKGEKFPLFLIRGREEGKKLFGFADKEVALKPSAGNFLGREKKCECCCKTFGKTSPQFLCSSPNRVTESSRRFPLTRMPAEKTEERMRGNCPSFSVSPFLTGRRALFRPDSGAVSLPPYVVCLIPPSSSLPPPLAN